MMLPFNIYVNKMAEIDNSMLAELEQESRLMRARNARLEAEVTVLTEMVRVLSDKLAQIEAKQKQCKYPNCDYPCMNLPDCQQQGEPVATDDFFKTIADRNPNPFPIQQRTWVGLTWNDVPDEWVGKVAFMEGTKWADKQLKEKNT
jgi:hypothetical protein